MPVLRTRATEDCAWPTGTTPKSRRRGTAMPGPTGVAVVTGGDPAPPPSTSTEPTERAARRASTATSPNRDRGRLRACCGIQRSPAAAATGATTKARWWRVAAAPAASPSSSRSSSARVSRSWASARSSRHSALVPSWCSAHASAPRSPRFPATRRTASSASSQAPQRRVSASAPSIARPRRTTDPQRSCSTAQRSSPRQTSRSPARRSGRCRLASAWATKCSMAAWRSEAASTVSVPGRGRSPVASE